MPQSSTKPVVLYREIVDDIRRMIAAGELPPGRQLFTLNELCARYGVSRITATRALDELRRSGHVQTFRRRGAFICGMPAIHLPDAPAQPVTRIIATAAGGSQLDSGFRAGIWAGLLEETQARRLSLSSESLPVDLPNRNHLPFALQPGHGVVAIGGVINSVIYSLLADPRIAAVLVDGSAIGVHSILTDNADGMRRLVDHLQALGHRRFALAAGFSDSINSVNENERHEAFRVLMRERGLTGIALIGGEQDDLFRLLRGNDAPTAFLFTQDSPALEFLRAAREKGLRVPEQLSVAGFDDWPAGAATAGLTTVRVNGPELGRRAVRRVVELSLKRTLLADWVRIAPELAPRSTTGPAPRNSP
jgi:DNA-binding LacI/PurR family transcriptional regulator